MRILLAEDDRDISKALVEILQKNNYSVDAVFNGKDAYEYGITGNYDGMIFDIMMPVMDGVEALRQLREKKVTIPVLLLTAKSEISDRVEGLDAGADDYLPKPFAVTELLARIRAMLRRKDDFLPDILHFHSVTLNRSSFELGYEGKFIRLSSREYQMMEMLMEKPEHISSTEQFIEHIWGWDSDAEVNIVWVYISNLRKRLASLAAPIEIRAVRGVGYYLEAVQ